ncbi:MAG TPA: glycine--tRNA ligase [Verrucomicrobiae bacterium]|jgi:glycyl-tRNA synthetase|nr:glycine--tRNA ligase [Verrucomicrobiae bacterium]
MSDVTLETIVSLCKRRGFIYQGSEVYGGLAGTWDYGPLGVQLKRNIMQLWWKMFVEDRDDMLGVDAAILMNQKVWQASGHVDTFEDPSVECMNCNARHRVDKLIDEKDYQLFIDELSYDFIETYQEIALGEASAEELKSRIGENLKSPIHKTILNDIKELPEWKNLSAARGLILRARRYEGPITQIYLNSNQISCPTCHKVQWGEPEPFNMMFKTVIGPRFRSIDRKESKGMKAHIEWLNKERELETQFDLKDNYNELGGFMLYDSQSVSYLRPETAQGIFTNYKNVVDSFYPDVPFGIAQQGKAFRNEISPRDFVFRSREFEQMEIEYFIHEDTWEEAFEAWRKLVWEWTAALGLPKESVHELEVPESDRAHYSKRTIDFEFDFPIGREELLGLAYRTDFDLRNIERASGKSMEYRPKDGSAPFVPHVIEPSFGLERTIMAVLTAAYTEDEINGEKRSYLKLPAHLAPVKVAVSPLLKNKPELAEKAREVYKMLKQEFGNVMYDDNGNIGKRYRRQDEIGTPYCVTIDFDTLTDNTVTVRRRDTTEQKRVPINELVANL